MSYCFHFGSAGEVEDDLPTDEWCDFIAELGRAVVMDVCLGGGEPLLRPDLKHLITTIVSHRMRLSIIANGTLISDELASFLAETGRCNGIQVSLDGSVPGPHDACRGEGSFRRALRGLQCLQQHAVPITVRATIHHHNLADLENTACLLLEELGLPSFSTNSASNLGLCRENAQNLQLTPHERTEVMEWLLSLVERYGNRISATAGLLAEALLWTEMENARRAGKPPPPDRGYLLACRAVMRKMAVRADGAMVPCSHLSHLVMGWINRVIFSRSGRSIRICDGCANASTPRSPSSSSAGDVSISPTVPATARPWPTISWASIIIPVPMRASGAFRRQVAGCRNGRNESFTEACNLPCRHCWISPRFQGSDRSHSQMEPALFAAIVDQALPLGLTGVELSGGEPLLHPALPDILRMAQAR